MNFYLINNYNTLEINSSVTIENSFFTCFKQTGTSYIMTKDNFSETIIEVDSSGNIRYKNLNRLISRFFYTKSNNSFSNLVCSRLITTANEVTSDLLHKIDTGFITGKFKIKKANFKYLNLKYTTIPVNFTFNNKNYSYFYTAPNYYLQYATQVDYNNDGFILNAFSEVYDTVYSLINPNDYIQIIDENGDTNYNDFEIDFGDTPQEVPQEFINFIKSNFSETYNNSYTIMSYDGTRKLFSTTGKPPIINESLYVYGNPKILEVFYENSYSEQFNFSDSPPESNMQFVGLALEPNSKTAVIPIGEYLEYDVTQSTVFYESYDVVKPPSSNFDINLYTNIAENNRVDKTNYITSIGTLQGVLRDECSITDPSIIIQSDILPNFNYIYIPIWNRYYYVNEITSVRYGLWRISLHVDVLMTYKVDILNLNAIIDRQEFKYNRYITDRLLPVSNEPNITIYELNGTPFNTNKELNQNYVLTVVS